MRALRNIAIIALLALIVAEAPGGGDAARGILAALTICFLFLIGFTGRELLRRYRLELVALPDRQRLVLASSAGAIVLMIAGADELTASGPGVLAWIAILALAGYGAYQVLSGALRSY